MLMIESLEIRKKEKKKEIGVTSGIIRKVPITKKSRGLLWMLRSKVIR